MFGAETLESRSEIPGKFWNVVLEKDEEDQLDRPYENEASCAGTAFWDTLL
jgi:hypothetical protein